MLWKLIGELQEPLDRSRPMWTAYVIDGLEGGRFAFYIKVHHTVVDGVAGVNMIADALTTDPESRSMRPIYAIGPKQPAEPAGNSPALIGNPLSLVRSLLDGVTAGLGLVRQLAVGEVSTVFASLGAGTTVRPFSAPYTRFNGRRRPVLFARVQHHDPRSVLVGVLGELGDYARLHVGGVIHHQNVFGGQAPAARREPLVGRRRLPRRCRRRPRHAPARRARSWGCTT